MLSNQVLKTVKCDDLQVGDQLYSPDALSDFHIIKTVIFDLNLDAVVFTYDGYEGEVTVYRLPFEQEYIR